MVITYYKVKPQHWWPANRNAEHYVMCWGSLPQYDCILEVDNFCAGITFEMTSDPTSCAFDWASKPLAEAITEEQFWAAVKALPGWEEIAARLCIMPLGVTPTAASVTPGQNTATCAHTKCGKTFHPTRSDALYCSDRCRVAASRQRKRAGTT